VTCAARFWTPIFLADRTFWWAVLWFVLGWLLTITIIGAVIGLPLLLLVGLWVILPDRARWLALVSVRPMPM